MSERVTGYFRKYLDKFAFVELSEEYLTRSKIGDIMDGVPVPLKKEDLDKFSAGEGVTPEGIAEDMSEVMGCDPDFRYAEKYTSCINRLFADKYQYRLIKEAGSLADSEHFDRACVLYRAALCLQPEMQDAMYGYARVCRNIYMEATEAEDEETVGRFKAESMESFERLTQVHPKFAPGYYYLGFAYLNIGLYVKSDLAWREYLKLVPDGKDNDEVTEIKEKVTQLKDPVEIEKGCNEVIAGRFENGIVILEPYIGGRFDKWWPLHYYLGTAYARVGDDDSAEPRFKRVLQLNAAHIETMEELCDLYQRRGDGEGCAKYKKKIELVKSY